jgi:hypothetical protein
MYNPHMSPRPEGDVPTLLRKGRELLQEYEDESGLGLPALVARYAVCFWGCIVHGNV